jgi:hypothetical protein
MSVNIDPSRLSPKGAFILAVLLALIAVVGNIVVAYISENGTNGKEKPSDKQSTESPANSNTICIDNSVLNINLPSFTGTNGDPKTYTSYRNDISYRNPENKTYSKSYEVPFQENKDSLSAFFFRIRSQTYQDAVREVCDKELPFSINIKRLNSLLKHANAENKEDVIHEIVDNLFFVMYDSLLTYDSCRQVFIGKIGLGYKLDVNKLFPAKIRELVTSTLKEIDSYLAFLKTPLEFDTDYMGWYTYLLNDPTFKSNYCKLIKDNREYLSIFFESTDFSNCSIFFQSGDYKMNPITTIIVKLIADEYAAHIKTHPQQKFSILASGFADGQAIRDKGIAYGEEGRWSVDGGIIKFGTSDGELIGNHIEGGDRNGNLKLAYARAHTGMKQIVTVFDISKERLKVFKDVKLLCTGEVSTESTANALERRIEFKLIKQ